MYQHFWLCYSHNIVNGQQTLNAEIDLSLSQHSHWVTQLFTGIFNWKKMSGQWINVATWPAAHHNKKISNIQLKLHTREVQISALGLYQHAFY